MNYRLTKRENNNEPHDLQRLSLGPSQRTPHAAPKKRLPLIVVG